MSTPDPSPIDRSDRHHVLQLLLGVGLFFLIQVVRSVVPILVIMLVGREFAQAAVPWALLIGACLATGVAIGGYLLIVGAVGSTPGLALGGRGKLAELTVGLVIGTVLISLSVGLIALLGGYRVTGLSDSPQLLIPLAAGIGAGFVEEIMFRGILLRLLDVWLGSWAALAITALLFGLLHALNPGATLLTAIGLMIEAGILLGAAYLLTRRLWLAIGIHLAWNAVQGGVFSSSISGTGAQRGLLQAETSGPTWLTGGEMGIEGSVVTVLVGLGAGIVMLVLASHRGHLLPSLRTEQRRAAAEEQSTAGAGSERASPITSEPEDRGAQGPDRGQGPR